MPGRRPARRRRRLPGAARALRRGRQRPGPARVARRPLRRLRRARLGDLHGQADPEAALRPARACRRSTSPAVGEEGWRERCAAMGLPLWVKPSRLGSSVGISQGRGARSELDAAVELALRHDPRVIVEASRRRPRGRVLGARQRASPRPRCRVRSSPTPTGTTTRPSTARAAWSWSSRRRSPSEQAARVRELAARGLRARRLLRPRPLRLLRRARTARSWSTRSTRCPASPRPASTPSSGRPAASPTRTSATAWSRSPLERHAQSALLRVLELEHGRLSRAA